MMIFFKLEYIIDFSNLDFKIKKAHKLKNYILNNFEYLKMDKKK